MKTTITFKLMILAMLFSFTTYAQTHVYNESVNSNMWIQPTEGAESTSGGEVANPKSDNVNSTATVVHNATDANWRQIQYFPTYTPVSGDKLFFSVYNPNNAGPGQVQFRYSSDQSTWQFGANVTYTAATETGWVEYSVNLSAHVGNEIDQIIIMPAGDSSAKTYIDNIYFNDVSLNGGTTGPSGPVVVYDESTNSGMWIQPTEGAESTSGGEVANPKSDNVNSTANVVHNATDANWRQIQYFPTYTPVSGDKLFFSVYNPNNAGPGQVQFRYSSDQSSWQFGANVTYTAATQSGWVEYSVDLSNHIGNEIDQVIIMPAGDNSAATYIDNIYFNNESTLSTRSIEVLEGFVFFDAEGRINFEKNQTDVELKVYDLTGRLLIQENLEGRTSKSSVSNRGVYILKVSKEGKASTKKLFFK